MIHQELVPGITKIPGEAVTIRCSHGDITLHPLADVHMEVDGVAFTVWAALSKTLPVSVLLGTDWVSYSPGLLQNEAPLMQWLSPVHRRERMRGWKQNGYNERKRVLFNLEPLLMFHLLLLLTSPRKLTITATPQWAALSLTIFSSYLLPAHI